MGRIDHRRTVRSFLVIAIALFYAIDGARRALVPTPTPVDFLISLGYCGAFAMTCQVDSRIVRKPVIRTFVWMTFFAWPILFPGYLVWSRGLKGIAIALAFAMMFVVLYFGSSFIVRYAVYGQ